MANDKDFIITNAVEVGGSVKTTVGTLTSGSDGYNLAGASYDSVSFDSSSQVSNPQCLVFNDNGTKMYILSFSPSPVLYQYSLSTAFDISTASYSNKSFSFGGSFQTDNRSFMFKPDGSKMYAVGTDGEKISSYSLSTYFDVDTATLDTGNFDITAQTDQPSGMCFNSDGSKLYVTDRANDRVHQYSLSTDYDITSMSYDNVFIDVSGQDTTPRGAIFSADGTIMYLVGGLTGSVYEYSLTTAFDLSTASYSNKSFSHTGQVSNAFGVAFNSDVTKMYLAGSDDTIYQYSTLQATQTLDLSTGNYFNHILTENTEFPLANAGDVQAFQLEVTGGNYNPGTWSSGGTFLQSFSYNADTTRAYDVSFKTDGTRMYLLDGSADTVIEYNLSTAWDISTSTYVQELSIQSQETSPRGFFFKPDGTKMYLTGLSDFVYEYDLTTAWDISTLSYLQSFDLDDQDTTVSNIFFRDDGIKMYMIGQSSNDVHEYDLSTAWDISTLSYLRSYALASLETSVRGLFFKSDGTRMYVVGDSRNELQVYDLSTAWRVTSSSLALFRSVSSQDLTPLGLFFKPDGSKMYITGDTNDSVYQYDIGEFIDFSITWPTSIEWAGGVAPDTPANGETDLYAFTTDDSGTTYKGVVSAYNLS
jgi:DNA-binding beta-propeller fold protein YncE